MIKPDEALRLVLEAVRRSPPLRVPLVEAIAARAWRPLFSLCNLVLVEGHVDAPGAKIELWREAARGPCLAIERSDIAVVAERVVALTKTLIA